MVLEVGLRVVEDNKEVEDRYFAVMVVEDGRVIGKVVETAFEMLAYS